MDVSLSDQFFGWIFALGTKVKIEGPKNQDFFPLL